MVRAVMRKTGFVVPSPRTELLEAYERHVRRIQNLVPAERLLVFDVAEGWEPLCAFLGKPVPDAPFPRTNATHQFWESVGDVMPPPIDV